MGLQEVAYIETRTLLFNLYNKAAISPLSGYPSHLPEGVIKITEVVLITRVTGVEISRVRGEGRIIKAGNRGVMSTIDSPSSMVVMIEEGGRIEAVVTIALVIITDHMVSKDITEGSIKIIPIDKDLMIGEVVIIEGIISIVFNFTFRSVFQ